MVIHVGSALQYLQLEFVNCVTWPFNETGIQDPPSDFQMANLQCGSFTQHQVCHVSVQTHSSFAVVDMSFQKCSDEHRVFFNANSHAAANLCKHAIGRHLHASNRSHMAKVIRNRPIFLAHSLTVAGARLQATHVSEFYHCSSINIWIKERLQCRHVSTS